MSEVVTTNRGWGTGGGRQKGTPNKKTAALKEATKDFFRRIVDDDVEAKFWRHFITGFELVPQNDGTMQLVPIPLDPVAWQAFKRAVEYKRGMPVQLVEHVNADESPFRIEISFRGAEQCQQP